MTPVSTPRVEGRRCEWDRKCRFKAKWILDHQFRGRMYLCGRCAKKTSEWGREEPLDPWYWLPVGVGR